MTTARLNLVLLAVAVGLFALLAVDERQEQAALAKAIEAQPPLTPLDADAIRRIRLANPGSPDIVLEKTGSGWQLREPVALAADLVKVGDLTALATRETRGAIDTTVARRADLGLDPPRSTITLDDLPLALGEIEPLKRARYIERNPGLANAEVRLVDEFALEPFDGEYTDLVNKALLPHDAEIVALSAPGLELVRDAASGVWAARPASAAATPDAIAAVLAAWHEIRAQATLPPLADVDADAAADVRVRLADGTALGYRLVDRAGSRFLQRLDLPVSYQFLPADADRLLRLSPPAAPAP